MVGVGGVLPPLHHACGLMQQQCKQKEEPRCTASHLHVRKPNWFSFLDWYFGNGNAERKYTRRWHEKTVIFLFVAANKHHSSYLFSPCSPPSKSGGRDGTTEAREIGGGAKGKIKGEREVGIRCSLRR